MTKKGKLQRETGIRVDSTSEAVLLNRYLCKTYQQFFFTKGSWKENTVPVHTRTLYEPQWQNVTRDIKAFFTNPFRVAPAVAYSILAFPLIFLGKHQEAFNLAFFGTIAHDSSAEVDTDGEPASVSYTHTIVDNTDGFVAIAAGGLNTPNAPTWDSNSVTAINQVSPLRSTYYLAPSTGNATVALDGGNIKNLGSIAFTGVDQTTPVDADTTESDSSSPNDMTLTTNNDNSVRIDWMQANRNDSTTVTTSLDSGTKRIGFNETASNQFRCNIVGYTNPQASAGADTHQWTTDANETRKYSAFEVVEAAGAGEAARIQAMLQAGFIPYPQ